MDELYMDFWNTNKIEIEIEIDQVHKTVAAFYKYLFLIVI
jgi:hypothetical protein